MTTRLEKGDKAPRLELPISESESVTLGAPQDKAQVIFFYPKDNTPGCTTEAMDFSALKPEFDKRGVEIIGVSKDSLSSHARFSDKKELTIALASDEKADACEQFGVWVEKNMYGKKFMGIERSTFLIVADGTVAEIWRKVKVKGHAQNVLDLVRETL